MPASRPRSTCSRAASTLRLCVEDAGAHAAHQPLRARPEEGADALLADLPGYGYAAVERGAKLRWQQVMADYLGCGAASRASC